MMVFPKEKQSIFKFNIEENEWKLYFSIGIALGGFIAANLV
jgi:hypothetical protein